MGMARSTRERGREQAGMTREGRRTMEKVLENTVRDKVRVLWLCVLVLHLRVSRLLSVATFKIWVVRMLIGLLMWAIGRVFLDILFISRDLWSLGLRLNRNRLLCRLLRLNTMLWLMRSKRPSGYVLFLACCVFLSLALSLFFVIIRLPVRCPTLLLSLLALNTSTSAIIFFAITFRLVLSPLLGFLLRICRRTFLRSPFLWFISPAIVMFLVFPFLHFDSSSFFFLLPSSFSFFSFLFLFLTVLMGVC